MSIQNETDLLVILRRLYSRIISLYLKARASTSANSDTTGMSHNFVLPLSDYIEKLAANAEMNKGDAVDSLVNNVKGNGAKNPASLNREHSAEIALGELSTHLRNSHMHSGVSLNTGDKLIQSTWEHFHASIRSANKGDVKTARLHAELANNALKEAAHYLPESVYSSFSKEVMEALKEINSQST